MATVTITITNLNDAPVAVDDAYTMAEDTLLTIAAPGSCSWTIDASTASGLSFTTTSGSGPASLPFTLASAQSKGIAGGPRDSDEGDQDEQEVEQELPDRVAGLVEVQQDVEQQP